MPSFYAPGERTYRKGGKVYKNETWVVRGRVNGVQYEKTTGCLHRKGIGGAEEWWSTFEAAIWAGCSSVPTRETATFADACLMYRAAHSLSVNEGRFVERLEARFGAWLLTDISPQDVIEAAPAIYPAALPQTWNRQAIRPALAVIHHAATNGLCDWLKVSLFDEDDPQRPLVSPTQGRKAIQAAAKRGEKELVAILTTLVYQGWRIGETLAVLRENVDFRGRKIHRFVAKSRKWRWAAVVPEVVAAWRGLPRRDDGRLFGFSHRYEVYRAIDKLGLPFHYRPHMSRRGFATALKDAGHDIADIMEAGQWEDPKSVQVYVADNIERQRRTLQNILRKKRGRVA